MNITSSVSTASNPTEYTAVVSGVRFRLSRAQITFDAPNLFTQSFLGDFVEASTKTLHIDGDAELFKIIADFMKGYNILPLDKEEIPRRMTVAEAKRYLVRDAEYLGLSRLSALFSSPKEQTHAFTKLSSKSLSLDAALQQQLPVDVFWTPSLELVDAQGLPILVHGANIRVEYKNVIHGSLETGVLLNPSDNKPLLSFIFHHHEADARDKLVEIWGTPYSEAVIKIDNLDDVLATDLDTQMATSWNQSSELGRHVILAENRLSSLQSFWGTTLWGTIFRRQLTETPPSTSLPNNRASYGFRALHMHLQSRAYVALQKHLDPE